MEKQSKVVKKINKAGCDASNLRSARAKPNDECYTDMQDILNEVGKWAALGKLTGKKIICPCDWDAIDPDEGGQRVYKVNVKFAPDGDKYKVSYLALFDKDNNYINYYTSRKGMKKAGFDTTGFEFNPETGNIIGDAEEFARGHATCNFLRALISLGKRYGIESITAQGYNPTLDEGFKFQDVDYSKYDVCITNPPFSLYGEFIQMMLHNKCETTTDKEKRREDKINFIALAPLVNRGTPSIGLPLMLKECFLGYGRDMGLAFNNPTKECDYKIKKVACDWVTSFAEAQEEINKKFQKNIINFNSYRDDYGYVTGTTMKDYSYPLEIKNRSAIPDDYFGWMFCSLGAHDVISHTEYVWYGAGFSKYFNTTHPEKRQSINIINSKFLTNESGKQLYTGGIVIRRRTPDELKEMGVWDSPEYTFDREDYEKRYQDWIENIKDTIPRAPKKEEIA